MFLRLMALLSVTNKLNVQVLLTATKKAIQTKLLYQKVVIFPTLIEKVLLTYENY